MRVQRVSGDGNCAFRAIAQGLNGGRLDSASELREALELRRTVAAELRKNAEMEMTGTGLTVQQVVLMKDTKFPTFNEYVNAMSRNEHAGETEFWLLTRKLNFSLSVLQPLTFYLKHYLQP